ncbi:MAG: SdpI family protein [Minisyncoccia bacterium]
MSNKNTAIAALAIVALSVVIGIYLYPAFPEKVASHWNAQGIVNGYVSRFWGLFMMPAISLVFFLLLTFVPRIDPKKNNIEAFRGHYNNFIVCMMVFFFYVHVLTIFYNLGYLLNIIQFLAPAFAFLFYYAGILVGHAKRNWFIGIRTPWTLESENVWDKTHAIGAKLFKTSGLIALLGIIFPSAAIYLIIIPILAFSLYLIVFSYFEYKKEKAGNPAS